MYKGIITNFHPKSGAGFIKCEDFDDSVYCHKKFVDKERIEVNDQVEFEVEEGPQGFKVTTIKKSEKSTFDNALRIHELNADEYDKFCDLIKSYVNKDNFRKNITTSKIRNIFSEVLKAKDEKEAKMLRPKLAYLAGRDSKTKFFMKELDKLIKQIETKEQLDNFKQFFEAIVCYKREIEK